MLLSHLAPPGAPNPEDLMKFLAETQAMNYCVVQDGVVINIIDWDGTTPYTPPEGCELHAWDGPVNIGWLWVDDHPVDPNPPPPPPEPVTPPADGGPAVL